MSIARESDATWVIPTEDEWYKPAFHKNDGVTGNYWKFATSSDTQHDNRPADPPDFIVVDPDPGDSATTRWHDDSSWTVALCCGTIEGLWRTEVGEWENSASPYGTFDQAGNVWEWFESPLPAGGNGNRVLRGGSYDHWEFETRHRLIGGITPDFEHQVTGFRLATLIATPDPDPPEPTWTMGDPIVSAWNNNTLTEPMSQHSTAGGFNLVWIDRSDLVDTAAMVAQLDIAQANGQRGQVHSFFLTPAYLDGAGGKR